MAVRILFDNQHNVIEPTFVLATRNGTKLGVLPAMSIQLSDNMNSYFDLSFKVYRYDGERECKLWDQIKDFKLLWCREWDVWFEIYVEVSEEDAVVKNVSARSLGEAELSQINLYTIEINTENDIAQDDYVPTVLYNADNPRGSLLHRIMEKAPHYTVKHVDTSIAKIQRTFEFDGKSLYDAFQEIAEEIDCIFVINSGSNDDGSIERSISVYDLESYCLDCGKRGDFIDTCPECGQHNIQHGYGEDTGIFICPENLASNITYSTDTDSVKNCFKLEAGDELMTATVRNCNPNGTDYIWYISDDVKSDMSEELVARLDTYNKDYEYYQNEYEAKLDASLLQRYNALVDKYSAYSKDIEKIPESIVGYAALMNAYYDTIDFEFYLNDELMPDASMQSTDANKEVVKLNKENLSPVAVQDLDKCSEASATSAVLAMAKVLVDSRYKVKTQNEAFNSPNWSGQFVLTNYSDEEDTATSGTVSVKITEDYEEFIRQRIEIALNDKTVDAVSLTELFKLDINPFKQELKKYCLQRLISFHDGCQTCVDVLIEQGIANNETWADKDPNMYNEVYIPYREKLLAIEEEMNVREDEIALVAGRYDSDGTLAEDGLKTLIEAENIKIQEALDFEKYLGEKLWLEFAAYRREDTYQNDNYISDGLNNAELFENAREFIEVAEKDIYKSATLQHSISATLKNLLVMREFEPIVDYFCVGNWLRVRVDGVVYRLRLISYQIDFDNLESLTVTFSDVKSVADGLTDSQSILDQAASMSSSYGSVSRQAGQGKKSAERLGDWVERGLSLTNMKIVGNADNQNIEWDNHGILCREYLPTTDSYDDRQLKIINRGIYLTDDNWLTARAGIGNFLYYDPEDGQTKESYGVIADTLIGNLILSKKVGIYNENNSITLDENGLTLKAYPYEGSSELSVFRIVNMSEEPGEDVVWIDENGNAHFKGDITATGLTIYDTDVDEYFDSKVSDSADGLRDEFDGKLQVTEQKFEAKDGELNSYIEGVKEDLDGYKSEVSSQFKQTAEGFEASVKKVQDDLNGYKSEVSTQFEQTEKEFDLKVQSSQTYLEGKIDEAANEAAEALAQQVMDFNSDIEDLQKQLDKHVMTWFYDYDPTLSNEPAVNWKTEEDKAEHMGDLFYNTESGHCWRWNKIEYGVENGTQYIYSWEQVQDQDIIQALADAAKAQDTADNKRRVFFDTPVPPYDKGDMWVNANYTDSTVTYKNEILRCQTEQPVGGTFSIKHWILASKYTDDSYAKNVEVKMTTEIKQTQDMISLLADKTTTTTGEYGDLMEKLQHAEFKLSADEIVQTVRESTEYQGDLNGIGSRNYILNSNFANGTDNWSNWGSPAKREIVEQNGKKWAHIVGSGTAKWQGYSQSTFSTTGITITGGQKYTFSARVKGGKDGQVFHILFHWLIPGSSSPDTAHQAAKDFTVGTKEQVVYATFTPNSDADHFKIMLGVDSVATAYDVYFTELKLEKGEHYTDWSPAPEEIQDSMSRIEQTADKITMVVEDADNWAGWTLTSDAIEIISENFKVTDKIISMISENINLDASEDFSVLAGNVENLRTYMKLVGDTTLGADQEPSTLQPAGLYVGKSNWPVQAFIDATGWFRVWANGKTITAMGPNEIDLGDLTFFNNGNDVSIMRKG